MGSSAPQSVTSTVGKERKPFLLSGQQSIYSIKNNIRNLAVEKLGQSALSTHESAQQDKVEFEIYKDKCLKSEVAVHESLKFHRKSAHNWVCRKHYQRQLRKSIVWMESFPF